MRLRLVYSHPPNAMPAIMSAPVPYAIMMATDAVMTRLVMSFGSR